MKGQLHVNWIHDEECPGYRTKSGNAVIAEEPLDCRCGMPRYSDLDSLQELVTVALRGAVNNGSAIIPGQRWD